MATITTVSAVKLGRSLRRIMPYMVKSEQELINNVHDRLAADHYEGLTLFWTVLVAYAFAAVCRSRLRSEFP